MRKLFLLLTTVLILSGVFSAFSQVANDFRSISDGNWNSPAIWEQYNGTDWVAAAYYPSNGITNDVTIFNAVTANVAVNLTNNLTVNGSLTLGASNFTVGGTTSISGGLVDNSNTGISTFTGDLAVAGTGTFTTTTVTTNGRMILSGNVDHSSTGTSTVGTATIGGNLIVNDGTFSKNAAGTLSVNGTTTINNSGAILLSNNSACVFVGEIVVNNNSTWASTAVATTGNMMVENGITQNSTGTIAFGAVTFANNSQEINIANSTGNVSFASAVVVNTNVDIQNSGDGTGAGSITFSNTITIADNITLTNQRNTTVIGTLNGGGANAVWVNNVDASLEYLGAAAPMVVGAFDVDQAGNTVNYALNGAQTVKITDYYNLQAVGGNVKTFASNANFSILNDLTIDLANTLQAANINGEGVLTVGGNIVNNGTFTMRRTATGYIDVLLTNSGTILSGSGAYTLANLTLNNVALKSCDASGILNFYGGNTVSRLNSFTNNGGSFTATAGTMRFLEAFSIQGTGSIEFNNLQVGNDNQTIQTLERDVIVNGNLTLSHNNTANSYFDIKNSTLSVLGNYTLANEGDFGSSTGAGTLNLGNGNTPTITGSLRFEAPIGTLNHNVTNGFSLTVTALTVGDFNNILGTFTATPNITINQNLTNNSTFNRTGGTTTFTNANAFIQTSAGSPITTFYNIAIAANARVTNQLDVTVSNSLNGSNAASTWVNDDNSTLYYRGTTAPMGTGVFDVNQPGNTVNYSRNGAQFIHATTYNNLSISGGNTKTLNGDATVANTLDFAAGTISIGANTLTLGGNLTGTPLLTGGATSNLTVNDAGAMPSIAIPTITLGTFTINRSAGASLSGAVTATNLNLNLGLLDIGTNNVTATNIAGFSASSYVVANSSGTLRQVVAASNVVFPVGTPASYLPITINNAGTSDTYFVNLFGSVTDNGTSGGTPITDNVANATWIVSENTVGGSNLTVTAQWNLTDEAVVFDRANSMLAYYNSGAWNKTSPSAAAGGNPYTQSRVVGANVGSFAAVDQLFLGVPGQWTGNTSSDWNTPSNWGDNSIPDGTVDVTIPTGRPNYPILNTAAATCNNLTIEASASLTANTANFTVNETSDIIGDFTDNSNTGISTFTGLITLNGAGTWTSTAVTTVTNMVIKSGLVQNSTGNFNAGAVTFSTNNQSIQGTGAISFGAVTIASDIIVTNQTTVAVTGTLNGSNAGSAWINDDNSTLNFSNATAPMVIGLFDVNQTGNFVSYNSSGAQTVTITEYYNLQAAGGNTKTFATNAAINVINNLTVDLLTTLQAANINGEGLLTIGGNLVNNGTFTMWRTAARYIDVLLTNSGTVLSGSGAFTFANLTLTSVGLKNCNASGIISFNGGNTVSRLNSFTNNGGDFTATDGTIRFIDASTFSIDGTGSISFYNLQSGNNTASILTLNREVTVNALLTISHSTGYFDLNDQTLNIFGNIARANAGQFRGTAASTLNLGNGGALTATSNFAFLAGFQVLGNLNHNTAASGFYYTLASALSVANLTITAGELQNGQNLTITNTWNNNDSYNQTANTTFFSNPGGSIAINGTGFNLFWNIDILANTTVNTTNDLYIKNNFVNSSNAATAFNATAGTVYISRTGATQYITGTGTGLVSFFNLSFNSSGTKAIDADFTVTNTMSLSAAAYVYLWENSNRSLTINNLIVGDGSAARLYVRDAGVRNHLITITGSAELNTGSYIYLWYSASRYADMVFTGSGNVVKGLGGTAFYVHSLTFTNVGAKSINYPGVIDLRAGATTPNTFTNNGGLLQAATDNTIRFRENAALWTIDGSGDIAFGILGIGANTTTNVQMNKNITVDGNLLFYQNNAANYLDLNGFTLTLNNNHTRQANGRIRGGGTSKMVINGTGNFTSTFAFDQTTVGTTNLLDVLDYNRANDGMMQLANLMEVNTLNLNLGIINSGAGSISVNTAANLNSGSFIDNAGGGTNSFLGTLTIEEPAKFTPTSNSIIYFSGSVVNHGDFTKSGGGNVVFTGNTTIAGDSALFFNAGPVLINDGITVTNNLSASEWGVYIIGQLNGSGVAANWDNRGILTYLNGTEPMVTGNLTATFNPNTVIYARDLNIQYIKNTTYHHLTHTNGGFRTMRAGAVTVNGNLYIGQENIFYTQEYLLTGNATGKLTMTTDAELRIGRDVAAATNGFPGGFIRANINFDPNSLITYNGQAQPVSHEPIYANMSITNGGSKTITGDVIINGYMRMTAGTLVFGATKRTVTIFGDMYASGGRIDMSGGGLDHELILWGAANQANRFSLANNSIVRYVSTEEQMVFAPTGGDQYGNLVIDGGTNKWLEGSIIVNTNINLVSGTLTLNEFNLTLAASAVTPISGVFSASNMIVTNGSGYLIRQANTAPAFTMLYPVGSNGRYAPANITSLTATLPGGGGSRYLRVRAVPERHPNVLPTYDALLRYWDFSLTNITVTNAALSFDYSPLDVIGDDLLYNAYFWNGSDFTNPAGSTVVVPTITIPTTNALQGQWTAYDNVTIRETLYSYKDGDWEDLDTWTTDPSGQLLEGSRIPANSDNVIILNGRTVELNNNLSTKGLIITINEGGALDMKGFAFDEIVSIIQGEGTIKLATNQMPLVALNYIIEPDGGTIEYNVPAASFDLNSQDHYNNLVINLPNALNKAVLLNNLTVYSNLTVTKGIFQVYKDDAAETIFSPITVEIQGDLNVESQGAIKTGTASTTDAILPPSGTTPGSLVPRYYDIYHKVFIGNNFTNNGSVRFVSDDINAFRFDTLTSRGAATVRFYGTNNTILTCNGTTDFYNLVVDKGMGQTAELNINASAPVNFRLFGCNKYPYPAGGVNPELRKALWIRNGTLRLSGMTTIPTLTEGKGVAGTGQTSYFIPGNGALVLDDRDVIVLSTADSNNEVTAAWGLPSLGVHKEPTRPQELYVYGRLLVNEGYLSTRYSGGIIYGDQGGEVVINGGKVSTRQIRTGGAGAASYTQTDGELELLGGYTYNTSGVAAVTDLLAVPIAYTHDGSRLTGEGSFNFVSGASVFSMSGGEMNIYNTSGGGNSRAVRILSSALNVTSTGGEINIDVTRNTQYDIECTNGWLPTINVNDATVGTNGARLLSNTRINGDLNLLNYARLNTNTSNFNLTINGNFTIEPNANYLPNQNTTTFSGDANTVFTVDGTITSNLFGLTIDKTAASLTLAGTNGSITTRSLLSISSGTLNDGGMTITAQGDIFNAGIHSGTGNLLIAGGLVNRTIGGSGTGEFGNVELNEVVDIESTLTANQTINGTMTMSSGPFNLDVYKLTLNGALNPNVSAGYSNQTLFLTAGNSSDAGLERLVTGNGSYLFPVATRMGGVQRFTPATATISGFVDDGYIKLNPVALELPTLSQDPPAGDALQYYWKAVESNFTAQPQADWLFTYDVSDISGDENLYVPGRVEVSTRIAEASGVNTTNNTVTFPLHNVTRADYTAAKTERFDGAVKVYYSRLLTANWYDPASRWDDGNNWSLFDHTVAHVLRDPALDYPKAGDIAVIGYGGHATNGGYHSINVLNGTSVGCAELMFVQNPNPGAYQSRLVVNDISTADLGAVSGPGTMMSRMSNNTNIPTITGDFGDFNNETASVFNYYMTAAGDYTIPTIITTYPNLRFEANGTGVVDADIYVKRNLTIDQNATLRLSSGATGNFIVGGVTNIGGGATAGRLYFPTDAERIFQTGSLNLTSTSANNAISVLNTTPNGFLHRIIINDGSVSQTNGTIDLFNGNAGENNATLEFIGETNANFAITGGTSPELYRLTVNKGTSQTTTLNVTTNFTLGAPTDVATKSLVIQNGTVTLNNAAINIELTSGGGYFQIPATAALIVNQGRVFVNSHNTGINLLGKLRVENNGIVWLGDGVANIRTLIQYVGLYPELEIAGSGQLEVNSQIRRSTANLAGSLRYRQTGGTVNIYGRDPNQGRAKLEVVNTGSEFALSGGTLSIYRGGGTTFGDLYLHPTTGNVTGGEVIITQGNYGNQTVNIDVATPLTNLTLAGLPANNRTITVKLMTSPLRVTSLFSFNNSYVNFNTNNRNVTLNGNLAFAGQWIHGATDSTVFAGTIQTITGSPSFNHLKVKPTTSLTMQASSVVTVDGTLDLISGQLIDGGNAFIVKKDVVNNSAFICSTPANAATGLKLRGVLNQRISGTGTFGLIELDNLMGATLQNSISLSNNLTLTSGMFNIGSNLLSLSLTANIVSGSAFSSENMILTDGVFGNNAGIKKAVPAGGSTFTYPIGVAGKYTPLVLTINSNTSPGSIIVKPVNQRHQSVLDGYFSEVLQYYWYMESEGISNLTGDAVMTYIPTDALGDEPNYVAARLSGLTWAKYPGQVDVAQSKVSFTFGNENSITGEYTAGVDPAFGDVVTYFSEASGVWDNPANWSRSDAGVVPASGPTGGYVVIRPAHTISTNGNRRNSYALTINGRLDIGTTYGHNFNQIDGTGTLSLDFNTLPAGRYDDFFSCTGGTIIYGGTTNYTIQADYPTIRNLTISGTGTISSPNTSTFTVCETLLIKNNSVYKQTKGAYYKGDIIMEGTGEFIASGWWTYFNGSSPQLISGNFTGANSFKNIALSNLTGFDILNDIEIYNNLSLSSGRIRNSGFRLSYMNSTAPLNEQGGNVNTFIEGRYRRLLPNNSNTHFFPVGKDNLKKVTGIVAPAGASNSYWTVEYMLGNPEDYGTDSLKVENGISRIEQNEFWYVEGPNTYTARLSFSLTGTSAVLDDIANLNDVRIVCWNPVADRWEVAGGLTTIVGNKNAGTLTCNSIITFNGAQQIYSFASVEPATAQFTSGNVTICQDLSTNLVVEFEGVAPFSITYTENGGAPITVSGITENPYNLSVSPAVTTTYLLTAMTHLYGNGIIIGSPVTVTVRPRPQVTIDVNSQICQDDFTDVIVDLIAGTSPFSFTYSVNGLLQAGINNVADPYIFNNGPLGWIAVGAPPAVYNDYVFTIETVTDTHGCINDYTIDTKPEDAVRVYKLPVTGPQYHIPNSFGE